MALGIKSGKGVVGGGEASSSDIEQLHNILRRSERLKAMGAEPAVGTSRSSGQGKPKDQSHPTLPTPGPARMQNPQPDPEVDGLVYIATTFPNAWIVDSGSTSHVCNNKSIFIQYTPLPHTATAAIGGIGTDHLQAVGIGEVKLLCNKSNKGGASMMRLVNVVHCPAMKVNVLSVSEPVTRGAQVRIDKRSCMIHYGARSVNADKETRTLPSPP
jgi:hypothetical protein